MNKNNQITWSDFWKSNPKIFNVIMLKATDYFVKKFKEKFPLEKGDVFLDYGCGPGFFIESMKKYDFKFIGIDISEEYINQCKQKFKNIDNYYFYSLESCDFFNLERIIKENKVNKILILSVIQYFKNYDQVYSILNMIKNCVLKDSEIKLYIADILPINHNMLKDGFDVLYHSIKNNFILKFIKFIYFVIFKSYNKSKNEGLLKIDPNFFIEYGEKYGINVEILKGLTIHSSRYSVLLTLSNNN